tara:strand:+ start:207 stop:371 length:165 start_codon:yes stop_codon:yes gene_type:complete
MVILCSEGLPYRVVETGKTDYWMHDQIFVKYETDGGTGNMFFLPNQLVQTVENL